MLKNGDRAPNFTLLDEQGIKRNLSEHLGQKVIIYFCHKNEFENCKNLALNFKNNYNHFLINNISVYCVTSEQIEDNFEFKEKYKIPFNILSDIDQGVAIKYGAIAERQVLNKTVLAPLKSLFIIDDKGKVLNSYYAFNVKEILFEVINYLK